MRPFNSPRPEPSPYICVIHPGMAGTVNVVASGTTTTQAEADAKAALTRDALLGAVDGLEAPRRRR